jgi:hypothetical protein
MRGHYEFNFPAFDDQAAALRSSGFEVFNPAERDRAAGFNPIGLSGEMHELKNLNFNLREAFAADCEYLCKHAEAIWLLPGWSKSIGANIEHDIAKMLGLTILGADE